METEEITKLVDGIYKNILDKFNPGARQLINAGKAYLKALHGAAAASRLYVEAISKLARQAQQGTWGGSSDIGSALTQIVEVYKEIQNQQMNILKAFYVDLLVPLETNLEKDTKVVQSEQKRFLQQHKQRSETYSKAAATMKKQRKKNKGTTKTGLAMDKELKNMQVLEEEKSKLDAFCEQSLKTAMTQERRRYGFVLERQCSLAKHYLAYHTMGSTVLQRHLDDWQDVAQTREYLPEAVEAMFTNRLRQVSFWPDEDVYSSPRSPNMEDDRLSIASQLRKTKSMDASCLDMRSISDVTSPMKPLSRAKSEFNLTASTHSLVPDPETPTRPKSMAVPERASVWDTRLARALYAYLSSGDNQLSFLEGDVIALMGERNKGWQFGENLRTQCSGWFPLAYTEMLLDDTVGSPTHHRMQSVDSGSAATTPATPTNGMGTSFAGMSGGQISGKSGPSPDCSRPAVTMFGDTLLARGAAAAKQIRHSTAISSSVGPPPPLPAPKVPLPTHPQTLPVARGGGERRFIHPPPMPPLPTLLGNAKRAPGAIGNASLHSSNDSGFSNEPPPAPEVDYSDDDSTRRKPAPQNTAAPTTGKKKLLSSVRGWLLYKSALDLWDDVNNQQANTTANQTKKGTESLERPLAIRQASSVGHLATLGRFTVAKDPKTASQEEITTRPLPRPVDDSSVNGTLIKRSKSLWKFKRSNRDGILEGMALWQHRSLIDVHNAVELELLKKKDNSNSSKTASTSTKTTLVAVKDGDGSQKDLSEQGRDLHRSSSQTLVDYDNSEKLKLKRTMDINDDGLLMNQSVSSGAESDTDSSDTESCIVVDDHIGSSSLQEQQFLNNNNNSNILSRIVVDDQVRPSTIQKQQQLARTVVDEHMRSLSIHQQQQLLNSTSPLLPRTVLDDNVHSPPFRKQQTLPRAAVDDESRSPRFSKQQRTVAEDRMRSLSLKKQQQQLSRAVMDENIRSSSLQNHQKQLTRSMVEDRIRSSTLQNNNHFSRTTDDDQIRSSSHQNDQQLMDSPPNLLPRTRLLKSPVTKQKQRLEKDSRDNGLLYYGRTLQKRLSKPDRGSRFDQKSQTTGNMCGPWYDLWGLDSSVVQ